MMRKTLLALIATVVICMLLSAPVLAAKGGGNQITETSPAVATVIIQVGAGMLPAITITVHPVGQTGPRFPLYSIVGNPFSLVRG